MHPLDLTKTITKKTVCDFLCECGSDNLPRPSNYTVHALATNATANATVPLEITSSDEITVPANIVTEQSMQLTDGVADELNPVPVSN